MQGYQKVLLPFSEAGLALKFRSYDDEIQQFLKEFPFLRPAQLLAEHEQNPDLYDALCGQDADVEFLLQAMEKVLMTNESAAFFVKKFAENLMRFFNYHVNNLKKSSNQYHLRQFIRSLPVFNVCTSHESTSINEEKGMMLPQEFASWKEADIPNENDCVYLKYDCNLEDIYKFLDIKTPTLAWFYEMVILPRFHHLSEESQMQHLELLTKVNFRLKCNIPFLELLKRMDLIKVNGDFFQAQQLFSPRLVIFKSFKEDRLLPEQYSNKNDMSVFIQSLGVQDKFKSEHLLDFAKQIEEHSRDPNNTKILQQKAQFLIAEIPKAENHLNCLQQLGTIEFFPRFCSPLEEKMRGRGNQFCAPKHSVRRKDSSLVWSQKNVIEDLKCEENIFRGLGVLTDPTANDILEHLTTVAREIKDWPIMQLDDFCKELNEVFEQVKSKCEAENVLTDLQFIPVYFDDIWTMANPYQILTEKCKEEEVVFPYVVSKKYLHSKIDFIKFRNFREELNISEGGINPKLYIDALNSIAEENLHGSLDVNTRKKALKAFELLLKTLRETLENGGKIDCQLVHFLATDGKMHFCSKKSMLFVDSPSVSLPDHQDYKIIMNHSDKALWMQHKYLKLLPENVQPEFLSNVMKREIENPLVCTDTAVVEEIKSVLSKREMFEGLKRIVRQHSNIKEKIEQDQKVAAVTNMSVKTVENLTVNLMWKGQKAGTLKESLFFAKKDLVYVDQNLAEIDDLIRKLCNKFKGILELHLEGNLYLHQIFSCKAHKIQKILDEAGLPSLDEHDAHLQIVLGENVKEEDLLLIDTDPRMSFARGEFVAIKDGSEGYVYAKIIGLLEPKPTKEYDRYYKLGLGSDQELKLSVLEIFGFKKGIDASINDDADEICRKIKNYAMEIATSKRNDLIAKVILRYLEKYDPEQYEEHSADHEKAQKIIKFIKKLQVELEKRNVHVDMAGIGQEASHRNRVARDNFRNHRTVYHPNPAEARRYLNQARHDLAAIPTDLVESPCWACYKGHQAAEKAINAVRLNVRGEIEERHLIMDSASKTGEHDLIRLSRQLENIVGHHTHMRYPRNGMIPAERFNHDEAQRVHGIAKEIVNSAAALIQ